MEDDDGILPEGDKDTEIYYRTDEPLAHEFRIPDVNDAYRKNGVGSWVSQENAHFPMSTGDTWEVRLHFQHKGPAGSLRAGAVMDYTGPVSEASVVIAVNDDVAFEDYWAIVSGTWNTDLPHDRDVSVIKFVETIDGQEYIENVDPPPGPYPFYTFGDPPPVCVTDADCDPGYECNDDGVCVPIVIPPCSTDADCPDGFVCDNGVCVPKGDWQDWIEEHYLEIGMIGAGLMGLILAWPKSGTKGVK